MLPTFVRDRRTGDIYLNDAIRYVKSSLLTPASNQIPIVIAAASSATNPTQGVPVIIEGAGDSVSEVTRFYGEHGGSVDSDVAARMSVTISDTVNRRALSNRDILVDHVFGQKLPAGAQSIVAGIQPFKLTETLWLEPQQTLQFQFYNNSTAGETSYRFCADTRITQTPIWNRAEIKKYMEERRARKKFLQPYWLTTDAPVSLPAGAAVDVFMTVSRDIRLVLFNVMERTITTGIAGDTRELWTIEVLDGQTERPLQSAPVARTVFAGNGNFPYWMPTGWMMEPNSKVHMRMKNLITDAATEVFLTWHGVACYVG